MTNTKTSVYYNRVLTFRSSSRACRFVGLNLSITHRGTFKMAFFKLLRRRTIVLFSTRDDCRRPFSIVAVMLKIARLLIVIRSSSRKRKDKLA